MEKENKKERGIYRKVEMQTLLQSFTMDPDAKAIFWHHATNDANMLDTVKEIQHAHQTLVKQGCDETRLVIKNGHPIIIQQSSTETGKEMPSCDPLCLGFSFVICGFALICKPNCWECGKFLNLKNLDNAIRVDEIIIDNIPLLTCKTLSKFIK